MHHTSVSRHNRLLWLKLFALALVVNALLINDVHAGAWPVRQGHLIFSPSFNYFHATRKWDKKGRAADYPDSGYFNSYGVYLYAEYGATRRLTVIGSIPFSSNTYSQSNVKSTLTGFGDSEFGARCYLLNFNFKFYLALQGTVIVPLYINHTNSNLGYQDFGGDVKLVGSGSAKLGVNKSMYYSAEIGGRQYFDAEGPSQLKSNITLGFNLDKSNQVSISSSGVLSRSTNKAVDANLAGNLLQIRDFSYVQATLSIGHTFAPVSIFANYTQFIVGKNTGIGTNLSLSFAVKL